MSSTLDVGAVPRHGGRTGQALRFAASAAEPAGRFMTTAQFRQWFAQRSHVNDFRTEPIPLHDLRDWSIDPVTGNIGHASSRFFTVEGLRVRTDFGPVPEWRQPILHQPEIGILGILVKEFDGVLHCLMSAKMEPGNVNVVQLSPTVQATRSNYTRVHRGNAITYLEYFVQPRQGRVLVDVLQSEQGSWFYQKRNRNIVVEVTEDLPLEEGFCWLTIGQLLELMTEDNVLNMDTRTVLSCIPFATDAKTAPGGEWERALAATLDVDSTDATAVHDTVEILSWLTELKARYSLTAELIPLRDTTGWEISDDRITHPDGKYFDVFGARVLASNREVTQWTQPLMAPSEQGVIAVITKRINGVPHVLLQARMEPGYLDSVEIGPTVQCCPGNYRDLPKAQQPAFLDLLDTLPKSALRYDVVLSEEGGRFYHASNRYQVFEVGDEVPVAVPENYIWMTLGQMGTLVRHSRYLNVQARSMMCSLHSLWAV
ncbi:NDP-hexose 2,3-dehydratase family protein [Kutzneria viridogrisea]|uniref:Oxidase EvaA n=1 Tax=Kutzneria viridogrisea TaxID=47990 RepID=A0ABR6BAH2_9PSEU|nr:oxidase EvaA [Kutzneria viridogrisea]